MKRKILIVDDEFLIRMSLESGLEDLGYQVKTAETIPQGLEIAAQFHPDAILLDNRVEDTLGIHYIADFKKLDEDVLLILMTAYGSVSQAVEAMKLGVHHYVQKPFDLEEVDLIIKRGITQLASKRRIELMTMRRGKTNLLGISPAIERIRQEIKVLAKNDSVDLLIYGETGTGKEVVVNTIHDESGRRIMPLVKINCSAIPENLLESELFGYEKGAFTGAVKSKKGLMEMADGGTLFLDEVGELPLSMQAKLLTFLEDRRFKRVGGLQDIEVNVRVIAATNRDLAQESENNTFRQDLYYRLNVMQIQIPPLRQRTEDIPVLAKHFLDHFSRKFNKEIHDFHPDFLAALVARPWKGNVRELRNVMERSVLFCETELLTGEAGATFPNGQEQGTDAFHPKSLEQGGIDLRQEVERFESQYIEKALSLSGGNLTHAAQLLGLSRFALRRRLGQEAADD